MILVGNRRGGAAKLAMHLTNMIENDHVQIHEVRGFIADDLGSAYHEAYGISRGTRCQKYLYSLSLSPPEIENVPVEVFEAAIETIESKLGFTGQPRTIVFHEKKGRRHAHVVWSRINAATMTAIDPYQDKLTLESIARELFLEHGWNMPAGLKRKEDADPFNYSHAQHQQAKRNRHDPKELKRVFIECWERSDSRTSFATALKENGLILAKGDRRGHVAVDQNGEVYAISRWVGVKAKGVRARLRSYDDLPSVDEALQQFRLAGEETTEQSQPDLDRQSNLEKLEQKRLSLVTQQREARVELEQGHATRRIAETKARAGSLPKGIKAIWFRVSGNYEALQKELKVKAIHCDERDRDEYQTLIEQQLLERRVVHSELEHMQQDAGFVSPLLKTDPAQTLIIPSDPDALTIKAKVNRDPAYILDVITDKKEIFTRPAVVRALAEYIDDPLKLGNAVDTAMRSDELVEIQSNPLPRYTTRNMLVVKTALFESVADLSRTHGTAVASRHINAAIASQNKALKTIMGAHLSNQQQMAIRHCLKPDKVSVVVGLAGAGKSTMLSAVRDGYERQGFKVHGAALSGKAADGLETSSGIQSRTLASWTRSWDKGFNQLTNSDVLVIDEAGMIGTRQLNQIIEEVRKSGAKIILVGDPEQLQPINAGTPFKDITEQIYVARLTEIHRQEEEWQKQASLDLAEQRIEAALNAYEAHGNVKETRDTSEAILNLVEDYMTDLLYNHSKTTRLALAYRRKDVHAINQTIRSARQSEGQLNGEVLLQTNHGKRAFAPSDRILLTNNDHALGIRNGMIGTVKSVSEDKLEISLDSSDGQRQRKITINPKLYQSFDHGYATTIHKSQGATVDKIYVLGSALMDRHLTYVAMTRHQENATLYGDRSSLQKMRRSGMDKSQNLQLQRRSNLRQRRGPTMH